MCNNLFDVSIFIEIIQIFLWCFILMGIFEKNEKKRILCIFLTFVGIVASALFDQTEIGICTEDGLMLMLISAISVSNVKSNTFKNQILLVVIVVSFIFSMAMGVLFSFGLWTSLFIAILSLLCMFVANKLVTKADRYFSIGYFDKEKVIVLGVVNYIIYVCSEYVCQLVSVKHYRISSFILFLLVASVMIIGDIIYNIYDEHMQKQIMLISYEQNKYSVANIKKMYEEASKIRHDIKNVSLVLSSYIDNGEIDKAKELLSKYTKSNQENYGMQFFCNNQIINYIISSKFSVCKENGIESKCIILGDFSEIPEVDMSILLGNLLDNAIEATVNAEFPFVNVEMYKNREDITIVIDNTVKKSVLKENRDLKTTKTDASKHGFGVISVKEIAGKYGGGIEYSENGDIFKSTVHLKYNKSL